MIHDDYTRYISQCKLIIKHSSEDDKEAPDIPLSSFMPLIIKRYKAQLKKNSMITYEMFNGQIIIGLSDIQEHSDKYVLLFEYSNKIASDPFFNEPTKRKQRKASKIGNEGYGLTAHLIIKKEADDTILIRHTCVLEEITGLNLTYIEKALNGICRDLKANFSYTKDDKKINFYPKLEFYRSGSQTFKEILNDGYVTQLTAIKYIPVPDIDSKTVRKQEQRLVITPYKVSERKALNWIRLRHNQYRNEFPLIKVTIVDKNKKLHTEDIKHDKDLTLAEIESLRLVEKEKINLSNPINLCQSKIHEDLIDKSETLLYK